MPALPTLRTVRTGDVDALLGFERANQQFFARWVPARAPSFFDRDKQLARLDKLVKDPMGRYCLIIDENDNIAGRINSTFLERDGGLVARVGYRIAQDQQRRGIATFALNTSIEWLKADGRFTAVEAYATRENVASVRTLEKAGLEIVMGSTISDNLSGRPITLQLFRKQFTV